MERVYACAGCEQCLHEQGSWVRYCFQGGVKSIQNGSPKQPANFCKTMCDLPACQPLNYYGHVKWHVCLPLPLMSVPNILAGGQIELCATFDFAN